TSAAAPKATARLWTISPVHSPSVTISPARRPCRVDWVSTKILSGPGANPSRTEARKKASTTSGVSTIHLGYRVSYLSDIQHDLAEVLAGLLMAEGIHYRIQIEVAVDDRTHTIGIDGPHHILLLPAATHQHRLQPQLLGQRRHQRQLTAHATENADHRDVSAGPRRRHGLLQGRRASHIDDAIHTAVTCQTAGGLTPLRILAIVDQMFRAQLAQTFQLCIAGRGGNHPRAQ